MLTLSQNLLDAEHIVVCDNFYTIVKLANKLLDQKIYLVSTLRSNRQSNLKKVITKKLKKGETLALQNKRGTSVITWHYKRDMLLLSTRHTDETTDVFRQMGVVNMPTARIDLIRKN